MKTMTKLVTVFVAEDGEEFDTALACLNYEHTEAFEKALFAGTNAFSTSDRGDPYIGNFEDLVTLARINPNLLQAALDAVSPEELK